jgi:hypothetical protein
MRSVVDAGLPCERAARVAGLSKAPWSCAPPRWANPGFVSRHHFERAIVKPDPIMHKIFNPGYRPPSSTVRLNPADGDRLANSRGAYANQPRKFQNRN